MSMFSTKILYTITTDRGEDSIKKVLDDLYFPSQPRHINQSRIILANLSLAKQTDNHWISYGSGRDIYAPEWWSHSFALKLFKSELCEVFNGSTGHVSRFRLREETPVANDKIVFQDAPLFKVLRRKDAKPFQPRVGDTRRARIIKELNVLNILSEWEVPEQSLEDVIFKPNNSTPFVNVKRGGSYRNEKGDWKPFGATSYYSAFCRGQSAGGRFYNGLSNLPRIVRQELLVEGCQTVELDYSLLHPRLLYCEMHPNEDTSYLLDIYQEIALVANCNRSEAKEAFNIVINASESDFEEWPLSSLPRQIAELLRNESLGIDSDAICSDKGVRLQLIDSEIALNVFETFLEHKRPILSWHDSFRVAETDEELLNSAMRSAFEQVTGTTLPAKAISRV